MDKIYVLMAQKNDYDTRPEIYGVTTNIEKANAWAGIKSFVHNDDEFPTRNSISERVRAYSHKKLIETLIQRGTVKVEEPPPWEATYPCWYEEHILV